MIRFVNGPADKQRMILMRTPHYVRVVRDCADKWDALDQLDDVVSVENPVVVAYVLTSNVEQFAVDGVRWRRHYGSFLNVATYCYLEQQPEEDVMRDNARWKAWCKGKQGDRK